MTDWLYVQIILIETKGRLYSPFPYSQTLVIRCGDKSSVLVDERDRVDGAQVSVVLLDYLAATDVPLLDKQHRLVLFKAVERNKVRIVAGGVL